MNEQFETFLRTLMISDHQKVVNQNLVIKMF